MSWNGPCAGRWPTVVGGQETLVGSSAEAMLFASPDVIVEPARDGCLLLRSAEPLGEHPVTVIHSLRAWAREDPGHVLVAERAPEGSWRKCTYAEATIESCGSGHRLPADRVPDLQDRLPGPADSRSITGTRASMNSICFSGVQYLGCSTEDRTTPFCTTRSRSM